MLSDVSGRSLNKDCGGSSVLSDAILDRRHQGQDRLSPEPLRVQSLTLLCWEHSMCKDKSVSFINSSARAGAVSIPSLVEGLYLSAQRPLGHLLSPVREPSRGEKVSTPFFLKGSFSQGREIHALSPGQAKPAKTFSQGRKLRDLNPKLCLYSYWIVLRALKSVWHFRDSQNLPSENLAKSL